MLYRWTAPPKDHPFFRFFPSVPPHMSFLPPLLPSPFPSQFQEKTSRERRNNEIRGRRKKNKARSFGPPTLRASTLHTSIFLKLTVPQFGFFFWEEVGCVSFFLFFCSSALVGTPPPLSLPSSIFHNKKGAKSNKLWLLFSGSRTSVLPPFSLFSSLFFLLLCFFCFSLFSFFFLCSMFFFFLTHFFVSVFPFCLVRTCRRVAVLGVPNGV